MITDSRAVSGVVVHLSTSPLEQAYRSLSHNVRAALPVESSATVTQSQPTAYADDDFSPAAVTDRIMAFIETRLATARTEGASDEEVKTLYQQALSGLEQGLTEARDQLSALATWTGAQQSTFNDTVNMLADRMTRLADDVWSTPTANLEPSDTLAATAANTQQMDSTADSYSLEILTRDGDIARIQISRSALASQSAQGQFNASQQSLSIEVNGTLDDQEMAAIDDLMQQVNKVASTFFNGDVDSALDQAMQVGMNTSELSAFAANMGKQSTAIRTHLPGYDSPLTESGNSPATAARQALASAQQAATQVMDARAFLNTTSMDQLLTDGHRLFQGLVEQVGALTGASTASQNFFNKLWELPTGAVETDLNSGA